MAAPKYNKNNQKWTEKTVAPYLSRLEKATSVPGNLFIGEQLKKLHLYRDIWSYWKRKFQTKETIIEPMDLIETMFERNLFKAAMLGEIPARLAIFSLRNAHGWCNDPSKREAPDTMKVIEKDIVKPSEASSSQNLRRA
jgi:hypothetical protein